MGVADFIRDSFISAVTNRCTLVNTDVEWVNTGVAWVSRFPTAIRKIGGYKPPHPCEPIKF